METFDAIALFSGGLDSILAARLLQEQGKRVKCLHFTSPFFGKPRLVAQWQKIYDLDIEAVDVGEEFCAMLVAGPAHGLGSVVNPCVDCKILLMRQARAWVEKLGARMLISGEVLGQRPMSQRRDTLNIIRREAGVQDILLRPLSALCLEPSRPELEGLVDREKLRGFSGRGRKDQMDLAREFGITKIPTPGGGCMLTEHENARRYWPLMERMHPTAADFHLANVGRQLWHDSYWLSIGRNQADNTALENLARPDDLLFKVNGFPGPLSLGRSALPWDAETVAQAAALAASYSRKAAAWAEDSGKPVTVRVEVKGAASEVQVMPGRASLFAELHWPDVQAELKARRKAKPSADEASHETSA